MSVSSARITLKGFVLFLLMAAAIGIPSLQASLTAPQNAPPTRDPAQIFQRGQEALSTGKLEDAERDFRAVLQADPQAGPAYANLGVVYMRRKQFGKALEELKKAATA